jgi:hypothetical protein
MIENIPRSVILTIKAAARDVANSVKGGAYNPTKTEKLAESLEKFMISMVLPSYPKVKSSWIDKDVDASWKKSAEGVMSPEEISNLIKKKYPGLPADSEAYITVERLFFSKLIGKTMAEAPKIAPELFGGAPASPAPAPLPSAPHSSTPLPSPSKPKEEEIAPARVPAMKPGEVKSLPEDEEFEHGTSPGKTIL